MSVIVEYFLCYFRIQSSTFDGNDVRTLGSAGHRISHPFGLALYQGILYKLVTVAIRFTTLDALMRYSYLHACCVLYQCAV